MAQQYSTTLRNTWLDSWETVLGTAAVFEAFTGAQPANCAAADSGTKLISITMDSDWAAAASGGSKAIQKSGGLPYSTTGLAAGTMAHYRIKTSGAVVVEQGSVTATGGGGDVTIDNTSVASGQTVNLTGFTKTAPGA